MKDPTKTTVRTTKKESRKASNYPSNQPSAKKQNRKGEAPIRFSPIPEVSLDFGCSKSWICKNSACRAVLSMDDAFCKRCSCCICHLFDDNKDPSLWLVCSSESGCDNSCGLSCHIECALQLEKVGVVDLGQLMRLDGSYCCASCGKVSGVIGNVKKQLLIAKDARRVDVLCYRIYLSFRLLDGTSRFKEIHEIIKDAKAKLETEVGPMDGNSAKMARGIVSRLSVASEVQEFCSLAIERADQWLNSLSSGDLKQREDSLPAACKFLFEEVTSSSITTILLELPTELTKDVKGYKLWYHKNGEEIRGEEPACIFPRDKRRFQISDLQPCTEYIFRAISYNENGDLGHSEAKCYTKSVEIIQRKQKPPLSTTSNPVIGPQNLSNYSGFRIRDLGKVLDTAWAQEPGYIEAECCEVIKMGPPENASRDQLPLALPDLNEEFTPLMESSRDEDNGCTLDRVTATEDDTASHEAEKNNVAGSCDSTLINGSPFNNSDTSWSLDENFEYCVKMIRWLECQGHIDQEFRLKFLTWFSLWSNKQERRVVNTFIQTLMDDPVSLAGQLVDAFSDVLSGKGSRSGLC
ncbi:hypothetical protein SAY86_018470 [Trapa natans]|uniref:Fibronectin type-III domain-containing protein n=1 Tax=Trapa natans TaxID=22666 RepID=A0AAN7LQZ0_TRANT|nr:hypothetical protein SAY86_018470 [Trapa natans]